MPTYIYETEPADGSAPERFEVEQRMSEPALSRHPHSGVPVRRIPAGFAVLSGGGRDEMVPCASGGCMLPKQVAAQGGPCGMGMCGLN